MDLLSPFITHLFNLSLSTGSFPNSWKTAVVTPTVKRGKTSFTDIRSYRPISHLPTLSKLLERFVSRQLRDHLHKFCLLPTSQSGFRPHHSTETAILKVNSDLLRALDNGDLALLSLLDLSSAFDTVDHDILKRRLQVSFGLSGDVLSWLSSYLSSRSQSVRCNCYSSFSASVTCGVPQGSVLGPLLFVMYMADLPQLIERHNLHLHSYADDLQVYGFCSPSNSKDLSDCMSSCILEVQLWLSANSLQLNVDKSELMWMSSHRRRHLLPSDPLLVGTSSLAPVSSVRCLGVQLDACLSMRDHVHKTVSACFSALRQIRSIRRSVPRSVLQSLIATLVHSRLDYCCAVFAGLPNAIIRRLQSVLNSAARLVFRARPMERVTPLLQELHWLKCREQIDFRLAVFAHRCLHDAAPSYLIQSLTPAASVDRGRCLRSTSSQAFLLPASRRQSLGDRAFSATAARAWNKLPRRLTSITSLPAFKRALKTELFHRSFPS